VNDAPLSVTLVRRIKAPAIRIYEAWTDPAKLARWWSPGILDARAVETDLRVGGAYRIRMLGDDGADYLVSGVYHLLQPPEKLVFSWALTPGSGRRSTITILLKAEGEETELTFLHEGDADPTTWSNRRRGWSGILDRLEREFG
jgi:uncharacterized protein YndB with AHSA1/START domain